ncbi:MAG: hypothetical protein ACE5JP_11600 [Candidatus Bipolaricaulia bacterium]
MIDLDGPPIYMTEFSVATVAEVEMVVTAQALGADWGRQDAESGVLTVYVDDLYSQDIVLFMGEQPFEYRTLLGRLEPGAHTVLFVFASEKSSPQAQGATVEQVDFIPHRPGDPDFIVYQHSPILYGRPENNYSDVPLVMWHERGQDEVGRTVIQYSVVWSNEDGGTDTPGLMARWGRATDIEWVYRITVDEGGRIVDEQFQAPFHRHRPFRGKKQGAHPILRVCTPNNNLCEDDTGKFRFFMSPTETLPGTDPTVPAEGRPRELIMDRHPWTYRIMVLELTREGKVETEADPDTVAVSDFKNYVYLGYRTNIPEVARKYYAGYYVHRDLEIQAAIRFVGEERWHTNDHDGRLRGIRKGGWARTTIEVPAGRTAEEIAELRFAVRPISQVKRFELLLAEIAPVFMLDRDYLPGPSVFTWQGEVRLDERDRQIIFQLD